MRRREEGWRSAVEGTNRERGRGDNEPQLSYGQHLAGTDKALTGTGIAFTPTKKAIYDLIVLSDIVSHSDSHHSMSQLVTALRISWHRRAALGGPCYLRASSASPPAARPRQVAQIAVKFPHVSTVTHGGSRLWRVRVLRVLHGVHGFRFTFDPTFLDYRPNAESTFAMRLRLISHGVEARKTKAALHNGVLALALEVGHIQNFRQTDAPSAPRSAPP
ncbi:hypothetical protein E4U37_001979 [Claviceps purpurea]|nr:hypothetical protein E4U37_001979 [Claviceps purpurea]